MRRLGRLVGARALTAIRGSFEGDSRISVSLRGDVGYLNFTMILQRLGSWDVVDTGEPSKSAVVVAATT